MTVDVRPSWKSRLEDAIRGLVAVQAVSVVLDGEVVREIHVLAGMGRKPKQVARDVQSLVVARFGRNIDHRVISVVQTNDPGTPKPANLQDPVAVAAEPGRLVEPVRAPRSAVAVPTPASGRSAEVEFAVSPPRESASERPAARYAESGPRAARQESPASLRPTAPGRIRFGSVNLYVAGPRAQAQVELRWKGITRMGSASGIAARDAAAGLVAAATVAAIHEFMQEGWGLSVMGVDLIRLGRREVAVVALTLFAHRQEKMLVGSCSVEQDAQQAVVLATLSALNRVVGGLPTREPTEYVLRPTSDQEDSEAK